MEPAILSLPHSNADAERIFSIVTDVKNKKRNRMNIENLNAICKIRSNFQAQNIHCHTFQIDRRFHVIQSFFSHMKTFLLVSKNVEA